MEQESTEQKIIMATIQLLGTEGLHKLTIRRVAERSGANVAAINYYFRSKENLINEALQHYAQLTQRVFAILQDESLSLYERLHTFLVRFSMHLITYPGFMRSILTQTMNGEAIAPQAKESMQRGRMGLLKLLESALSRMDALPEDSGELLKFKLFQMMGGLLYPLIWGRYTQELYEIDLEDAATRLRYIDTLLQSFFPELRPEDDASRRMMHPGG